jgi:hypothetical protein
MFGVKDNAKSCEPYSNIISGSKSVDRNIEGKVRSLYQSASD